MTAPFLVEFLSFITPLVLTVSISGNWVTLGVDQPYYLFEYEVPGIAYHDCKLASGDIPD